MDISSHVTTGLFLTSLGTFLTLPPAEANMKDKLTDICQDLVDWRVDSFKLENFMKKSIRYLEDVCKSLAATDYLAYRNLYNDILASLLAPYNEGNKQYYTGTDSTLRANGKDTIFILGFTTNKSAEESFAQVVKLKPDYIEKQKEIMFLGLNFLYQKAANASTTDKIKGEWVGNVYLENGKFTRAFMADKLEIDCV